MKTCSPRCEHFEWDELPRPLVHLTALGCYQGWEVKFNAVRWTLSQKHPKNVQRKLKGATLALEKSPNLNNMCLLDASSFSRLRAKFSEFISYLWWLPKWIVLAFVWYSVVMDAMLRGTVGVGGARNGQGSCWRAGVLSGPHLQERPVRKGLWGSPRCSDLCLGAERVAQSDLSLSPRSLQHRLLKNRGDFTMKVDTELKLCLHVVW